MNLIRKVTLVLLCLVFLSLSAKAQDQIIYKTTLQNPCFDASNVLVYQTSPSAIGTIGFYKCVAGTYTAFNFGSAGGGLTGSGSADQIAKWSGASSLTDSSVFDDGTTVLIGAGILRIGGSATSNIQVPAGAATVNIVDTANAFTKDLKVRQIFLDGATANSPCYVNGIKLLICDPVLTDGQLLIGDTGSPPVAANITGTSPITVTNGAGSITLSYDGNSALSLSRPQTLWGMVNIVKPPDSGSGTFSSFGNGQTLSSTGGTTHIFNQFGAFNAYSSSFGGGTNGILNQGTNYNVSRLYWNPIYQSTIYTTENTLSEVRFWIGLFSASPIASSTPVLSYIAFRYATDVDGTVFWRTVTDNGSGTPTVTVTTVPIAISTKYSLRFESTPSEVKFYIDDVLVATHTTNLPADATDLGWFFGVKSLGNAVADSKQIYINNMQIIQPR